MKKVLIILLIILLLIFISAVMFLFWYNLPKKRALRHYNKGKLYLKNEDYNNALKEFDISSRLKSDNKAVYYEIAVAKARLREYTEALRFFDLAEYHDSQHSLDTGYQKSQVLVALDKYDDALNELKQVPGEKDAKHYFLAANIYKQIGELDAALTNLQKSISLDDEYIYPHLLRAEIAIESGQFEKAENICNDIIINIEPGNLEAIFLLSRIKKEKGDLQKSLVFINQILEKQPGNIKVLLKKAEILFELRKMNKAMHIANHVLEKDYKNNFAHYLKGSIHLAKGEYEKAIPEFRIVLIAEIPFNRINTRLKLAQALYGGGRLEQSKSEYVKVLKMNPEIIPARLELAYIYLNQRKYEEALDQCNIILDMEPANLDALKIAAQAYLSLMELGNAASVIEQLAQYQEDPELLKVQLCYLDLFSGNFAEAVKRADLLLKTVKDTINRLLILQCKAIALYNMGFILESLEINRTILKYDNYSLPAKLNLSQIYFSIGQYQKAKELCREILEQDHENTEALLLLGKIDQKQNFHEEAINYYTRAITTNETDYEANYNIALIYSMTGRYSKAEKILNFLEIIYPYDLDVLLLSVHVFQVLNQKNDLIRVCKKLRVFYPERIEGFYPGFCYLFTGETEKAEKVFIKAVKLFPEISSFKFGLLLANLIQNKPVFFEGQLNDILNYHKNTLAVLFSVIYTSLKGEQTSYEMDFLYNFPQYHYLVNPVRELRSLTVCATVALNHRLLRKDDHRLKPVAFSNGVKKLENSDVSASIVHKGVLYMLGEELLFSEIGWNTLAEEFGRKLIQQFPDLLIFRHILGMIYAQTGDFDKAIDLFKVFPDNADYIAEMAYFTNLKGEIETAIDLYKKAIMLQPENIFFYYNLAQIFFRENKLNEALGEYLFIITREPDNGLFHLELAELYQKSGRYYDAGRHYTFSSELMPYNQNAWILWINFLINTGQVQTALGISHQALQALPGEVSIKTILAQLYMALRKQEKALNILIPIIEKDPKNQLAIITAAEANIQLENYNDAILLLKKLIEINIEHLRARNLLGKAYLLSGDYSNAAYYYQELLLLNPLIPDGYTLATVLLLEERYREALEILEQGLMLFSENAIMRIKYALALIHDGKAKNALQDLENPGENRKVRLFNDFVTFALYLSEGDFEKAEKAVQESPLFSREEKKIFMQVINEKSWSNEKRNTFIKNFLPGVLLLNEDFSQKATDYFILISEQFPKLAIGHYFQYQSQIQQGNIQEAAKILEKALSNEPESAFFLYKMATLYLQSGNIYKAFSYLNDMNGSNEENYLKYITLAQIYMLLGKRDKAFQQITKIPVSHWTQANISPVIIKTLWNAGRKEDIYRIFHKKLPRVSSANKRIIKIIAEAALDTGKYDQAIELMRNYLHLIPDDPDFQSMLLRSYIVIKEYDKARLLCRQILEKDPFNTLGYQEGIISIIEKKPQEAASLYKQGMGLIQNNLLLNINYAISEELSGNYNKALQILEKIDYLKSKNPLYNLIYYNTAYAVEPKKAARMLKIITTVPSEIIESHIKILKSISKEEQINLSNKFNLALFYHINNLIDESEKLFKSLMNNFPNDLLLQDMLLGTLLQTKNDAYISSLENIVKRFPGSVYFGLKYFHYIIQKGKLKEAEDVIKTLLRRHPTNSVLQEKMGIFLEMKKEYKGAVKHYEEALKYSYDKSIISLNNLALIIAEKESDFPRAFSLINKAIKLSPGNPELHDSLGWIYFLSGDYTKALKEFKVSVNKDFKRALFHYHLGLTYEKLGDFEKAKEEIGLAHIIDPGLEKDNKLE